MNYRMKIVLLSGVSAVVALATAPVLAVTCFEVFDRGDALIYRDVVSPVDLSAAGAAARDAMRARGETLVFFDTEACIVVGNTGPGRPLTTDEIMAEWQSFGRGRSGTALSRYGGVPAGLPAGATAPTTAPANAPSAGPAPGPAAAPAGAPASR